MWKNAFACFFLIVILAGLLFLALQSGSDSYSLSDSIQRWLGIEMKASDFRTIIHIPGYFLIGLALLIFGRAHGIKSWIMIVTGLLIGLLEETIKGFIPTRDFDWIDIGMDAIGLAVAALIMCSTAFIRRHIIDSRSSRSSVA